MSWLYVPALAESNSASPLPLRQPAAFVLWRGKPLQQQRLSVEWKRVTWLRLLSGLTLGPLTVKIGVDMFIASLPAIPASRSASPARGKAKRTLATSGRTSQELLRKYSRSIAFLKTSGGIFEWASFASTMTFAVWVTMSRRDCLRRLKLAALKREKGFSFWATQRAMQGASHINTPGGQSTTTQAQSLVRRLWTAAQAHDVSPRGKGNRKNPKGGNACLAWDAINWSKQLSHPARTKMTPGDKSSSYSLNLSPPFVEWLMGFPIGWTGLEPVATPSFHLWRLTHGSLLADLVTSNLKGE